MSDLVEYLNAIINNNEHKENCSAWSEGQYCCLELPEVVDALRKLLEDD